MQWMAATRLEEHVFGRPAAAPFGVDDALVNLGWDGSIGAEIHGASQVRPPGRAVDRRRVVRLVG